MSSRTPRSNSRSRTPDRTDLKGRVVTLHSENGFGFVELVDDPGHDHVFFHSEHIIDDIDIRQFREGDMVMLDLVPSKKKHGRFDGVNVRPEDEETKERKSDPGKRLRRGRGNYRSRSRDRGRRGGYDNHRRGGRSYSRSRSRGRRRDRSRSRGRRGGGYGGYDRRSTSYDRGYGGRY